MKPGETRFAEGTITLNSGRETVEVEVRNSSGHTLFISSHFPFFEVNRRLVFDRAEAWGMRLDIPAGDTVRWLPGELKTVRLVPFAGSRVLRGFNGLTDGPATPERRPGGLRRAADEGYGDSLELGALSRPQPPTAGAPPPRPPFSRGRGQTDAT